MKFFLSVLLTLAVAVLGLPSPGLTIPITYTAHLDGPSESPPNASPGTGSATVVFDSVAHTLMVDVTFSDLFGTTIASHIHAPTTSALTGTAGIATTLPTFPGFPLGVTSGTYDHTFDMTDPATWNPAFITANGGTPAGAELALGAALVAGEAYLNIHSTVVPGGEIRGFLVPLPAALPLFSTGLLGVGLLGWRRKVRS